MAVSRPMRRGREPAFQASEFGRQVAVDLEPDADFDERRCRPSHGVSSSAAHAALKRPPLLRLLQRKVVEESHRRNAIASALPCGIGCHYSSRDTSWAAWKMSPRCRVVGERHKVRIRHAGDTGAHQRLGTRSCAIAERFERIDQIVDALFGDSWCLLLSGQRWQMARAAAPCLNELGAALELCGIDRLTARFRREGPEMLGEAAQV